MVNLNSIKHRHGQMKILILKFLQNILTVLLLNKDYSNVKKQKINFVNYKLKILMKYGFLLLKEQFKLGMKYLKIITFKWRLFQKWLKVYIAAAMLVICKKQKKKLRMLMFILVIILKINGSFKFYLMNRLKIKLKSFKKVDWISKNQF